MPIIQLTYHELTSPSDPLLLPWLDLYETAFPPHERLLVSTIVKALQHKSAGETATSQFQAVLDEAGEFAGMVWCFAPPNVAAVLLGYFATAAIKRNQGLGAVIYQDVLARLDPADIQALIYDVEIPGQENSSPEAARRIEFYRRQGAFILEGITFMSNVGPHQPLVPMHVMVHPLRPMDGESAFRLAQGLYGEDIQPTGELRLV